VVLLRKNRLFCSSFQAELRTLNFASSQSKKFAELTLPPGDDTV